MMNDRKQNVPMIPYSKMGIKILSDSQLQNIFPTYDTLMNRIKTHREGVKKIDRVVLESDIQYNLMFDNVYSIMGKRGAGKTSVVFTLKEKLNAENEGKDIVLPIIMPEMIPKECSMIGWVLALLEAEVEKIEKKIKTNASGCFDRFNGCERTARRDSLSDIYEETKRLYYAQYYNVRHSGSFTDAVVNIDKMTQNSYSFSQRLVEFWGELIRYKKRENGCKEEPLLHIIFDDVDLVPERAIDLFSTIIKYLSYPNIVVYVTADEDLIFDVLENNMTRRLEKKDDLFMYNHVIGGLKREFGDDEATVLKSFNDDINKIRKKMVIKEKLIHETPRRYGEKVLPPSCRYYLNTFDDIDKKKSFIIDWYEYNERLGLRTDTPKAISIECFIKEEIERYMKAVHIKKEENFVLYSPINDNSNMEFISAYLIFWGSTSRQLTNEVFILSEFLNHLINLHEKDSKIPQNKALYCRNIYQIVWDFAYRTLNVAGSVEIDEIQTTIDKMYLYDEDCGGVYIDYLYLREKAFNEYYYLKGSYESNEYRNRLSIQLKKNISLFVMAFFIENMLKLENEINGINDESTEREKVHGMGILVDVLDFYVDGEYSLVCKKLMDDVPSFLWYYGRFLDQPHILLEYKLFVSRSVREYFIALPKNAMNKTFTQLNRTSPMWTQTMAQMLYFANERIYNIQSTVLDEVNFSRNDSFNDLYYKQRSQELIDGLTEMLSGLSDETKFDKYKGLYRRLYVNNEKAQNPKTFNYRFLMGQSLAHLQKIMMGEPKENGSELFECLCTEEERALYNKEKLPDIFGSIQGTNALLEELQFIRGEIMKKMDTFKWYRIYNFEAINDAFSKTGILWTEDIMTLNDVEDDKTATGTEEEDSRDNDQEKRKIYLISRSGLRFLLNRISSKRYSDRGRYSYFDDKEREDLYDGIYRRVENNCAFVITDDEMGRNACEVVRLFNYYSLTHRLYLYSYLKQAEETGLSFIDTRMIPYKAFYGEIKEHMKNNDYMGNALRRGISEAIRQYIESYR